MTAESLTRSLVEVAREVARGESPVDDLHAALLAATLYCERGQAPGFLALGTAPAGVVPVFTSLEQLALARGPVAWFALTGADLFDLLPAGYDVVLDIGGGLPVRLRPGASVRHLVIDVEPGEMV